MKYFSLLFARIKPAFIALFAFLVILWQWRRESGMRHFPDRSLRNDQQSAIRAARNHNRLIQQRETLKREHAEHSTQELHQVISNAQQAKKIQMELNSVPDSAIDQQLLDNNWTRKGD